ncbi:HflC protein [Carboxydothermus islandicus]|uniref:HflC protein n=1 Tax=Carboxydothermus islandicus TaxID=661089 RepID=A0A1L8D1F9_9THEO|nr:prohibitin family protein [Carboxydothermus islandicus]GAV24964.1 HflC protein [Carboxydothermus islandicus]
METNITRQPELKPYIKAFKILSIGILVLVLFFNSFVIIPAGHVGVLLQFGAVKGKFGEGLHFKIPFIQSVVLLDCRIRKYETAANAASKDLQVVQSEIAVNYHIRKEIADNLYEKVGKNYDETIIMPAVQESVKAVTARYTAEELITKRREVSSTISQVLEEKLITYGIIVDAFNVVNFKFSEKFNEAVEEKLAAEQRALKAKRDLERVKIEAEQKITQAKAEAEALKIQREQVTPQLLELRKIEAQLKAIEKWDGHLPNVTGDNVPFINIPIK